jgi:PPM family protein phosphatase
MTLALRYAAGSDIGLRRDGNEDSGYAGPRLLAVADGVGGAAAGEVASSVTIAHLAELDEDSAGSDLLAALSDAAQSANTEIHSLIDSYPPLQGMSTTLTALLWDGARMGLAHVGDSRGYLYRDHTLHQITRDHTLVQSLVDEGRLSPEEATVHPQRSVIVRALDGRSAPDLDLTLREALRGDRYLLCSDGLSDIVSADTLADTLGSAPTPADAVARLIELALRGGGPDNITCVIGDVVDEASDSTPIVVGAAALHAPKSSADRTALAETAAGRAALAQRGDTENTDAPAATPARRRLRWGRVLAAVAAVLVVLAGVAIGGTIYVRHQFYVGRDGTNVAIYRGVDGTVAGFSLHTLRQRTTIPISLLPAFERERIADGITAHGATDAQRIVRRLHAEACAAIRPTPKPSASTTRHRRKHKTGTAKPTPTPTPTPPPLPPGAAGLSCPGVSS